jgi:hypothetical protein
MFLFVLSQVRGRDCAVDGVVLTQIIRHQKSTFVVIVRDPKQRPIAGVCLVL